MRRHRWTPHPPPPNDHATIRGREGRRPLREVARRPCATGKGTFRASGQPSALAHAHHYRLPSGERGIVWRLSGVYGPVLDLVPLRTGIARRTINHTPLLRVSGLPWMRGSVRGIEHRADTVLQRGATSAPWQPATTGTTTGATRAQILDHALGGLVARHHPVTCNASPYI